jgi:hypothetical protein
MIREQLQKLEDAERQNAVRRTTLLAAGSIGAAAAVALAAGTPSQIAHAAGGTHSIVQGLDGCGTIDHFGWHGSEYNQSALDLNFVAGCGNDAGADVYLKADGSGTIQAYAVDHPTNCSGVDVEFYDLDTGAYLGTEYYTHIVEGEGVIGSSWAMDSDGTALLLGQVKADEDDLCPWTGPHLHQGGDNRPSTALYTNWGIEDPITPQWNFADWMHQLRW